MAAIGTNPRRGGSMRANGTCRITLAFLGLVISALASGADAVPPGFEKFYGEWVGTATSDTTGEIAPRDIRAKIGASGSGFSISWVLVIHKASGKEKRSEFAVTFQPTKRPNIYGSAMRVDMFGNAAPLDPLKGDPYMWA